MTKLFVYMRMIYVRYYYHKKKEEEHFVVIRLVNIHSQAF